MTLWKRPNGPLNVWKVIDVFETLKDGTKKAVKLSIQEVPNDDQRRKEIIDHLITYYLDDEPTAKAMNHKDDPDGIKDYQVMWELGLDQGVVVGCYKVDSIGKIGELIGVNVLFINDDVTAKLLEKIKANFKSESMKKMWTLGEYLYAQADVRKIYNVDRFIASISLSVLPSYRGQKIGYHLLNARSAVAKAYGFAATSTLFTAHASQRQAERAGFEVRASVNYTDYLDEKGKPHYPNINSKSAKIMMKRLP